MRRVMFALLSAVAVAVLLTQSVNAQVLVAEFSEQTVPTNPMNGFGSFTHGDFSAAGAVVDGPDSLVFDIVDDDASNGVFGGIGVDFGPQVEIVPGVFIIEPLDFNPAVSYWEVRLKILPDNAATSVRTSIRDMDVLGTSGDEHVFGFDLTGIPVDGEFHVITKAFTDVLFTQGAFGFAAGDGLNNPGMDQIQIQTEFGSAGRLNIEWDYGRIYTIPEPATAALLGLGGLAVVAAVRRRRK